MGYHQSKIQDTTVKIYQGEKLIHDAAFTSLEVDIKTELEKLEKFPKTKKIKNEEAEEMFLILGTYETIKKEYKEMSKNDSDKIKKKFSDYREKMLEFLDYLCIPFWIDDASDLVKLTYRKQFSEFFDELFLPDRVNEHSQQIIYETIEMLTFFPGEIGKDVPYTEEKSDIYEQIEKSIEKSIEDFQKSLNKDERLSSLEENILKVKI